MEVYFTSPILGKIYGVVTTEDHMTYCFKGKNELVGFKLSRKLIGSWICAEDQWLHDYQIKEIGMQIDHLENWLSAQ